MKLSSLLQNPEHFTGTVPDPKIRSIHYRSKDVKPGGLFVAIRGFSVDGHRFIDEAVSKGASAVVVQRTDMPATLDGAIVIPVPDTRKALSEISARFYGKPSHRLVVIGVTGTNGKTTTAYLIESILKTAGLNVGVIGTVNYRYADRCFPNPMTTPESLDLHRILSDMAAAGVTHVVMEVSSHAIDLDRIRDCEFDVGVFTNFTQDHLDYHKTMDAYWSCKKRFFEQYLPSASNRSGQTAVINSNDEKGMSMIGRLPVRDVSTGHSKSSMIRPETIRYELTGVTGRIRTPKGSFEFRSRTVGRYNLENILNAVGTGIALNIPTTAIKAGIENFSGVPGRLERISSSNRFVFVDYAHTPDALEKVLSTLAENNLPASQLSGKMICVFGCGGDRDISKRPKMGAIAERYCDLSVITSDNPRTEPPDRIIEQILSGMRTSELYRYTPKDLSMGIRRKGYLVESNRRRAIQIAIQAAMPGDIVLIAGKGHEDYQIIGAEKFPFDDRREAVKALDSIASPIQPQAECL